MNDVSVYHWGNHLSNEKTISKKQRNIPILEALLKEDPNDLHSHYLLAGCYDEIGNLGEAVREYDKALEIDPKGHLAVESLTKKAWALYNLKRIKEAVEAAKEALSLDGTDVSACNIIAASLIAVRELDKAAQALKLAAQITINGKKQASQWQKEYMVPFLTGRVYELKGNKEDALREYEKASQFDSTADVLKKLEELKWA